MCVVVSVCVTDPDGGLVSPEGLLLTEPAEKALPEGIPVVREVGSSVVHDNLTKVSLINFEQH